MPRGSLPDTFNNPDHTYPSPAPPSLPLSLHHQALPRGSPSAMSKEGLVLRAMQRLGITNPHTSAACSNTSNIDTGTDAGVDVAGTVANIDTAVVTADQWATVLRQVITLLSYP